MMIMFLSLLYVVICVLLGLILMIDVVNKKVAAAICYCVFLVVFIATLFEASGTPKDIRTEWRNVQNATLIASQLDEPRAIYIWVVLDDRTPKSYVLPWNIKTAEQLRKAGEEAKEDGKAGVVKFRSVSRNPFGDGLETEQMFWAPPQPGQAPKNLRNPRQ